MSDSMNEYEVVYVDGERQVIKASEHKSRSGFVNFLGLVSEYGSPEVLLRIRETEVRSIRLMTGEYAIPARTADPQKGRIPAIG